MVKSWEKCFKVHIYVLLMSIVGLVLIHSKFGFTKHAFLLVVGSHDILFIFYSIKGTKIENYEFLFQTAIISSPIINSFSNLWNWINCMIGDKSLTY
jgi:hypothetical protein